jgi:uncharacterized protein
MTRFFRVLLATSALAALASPSLAGVKEGVDAWERGDFATAVGQWRPMAVRGDADAQFNLAQAYRFGRGVPADMRQAEEWYRRAAQQGHLQAEDNLGLIMFQNGDARNAMPFIERSANRGEARAQYVLGTALFNGDTMQKDWPRAYGYMTRASASGLSRASAALAQMDQFIPLDQRQKGLTIARQLEANASQAKFAKMNPPSAPQMPAPVAAPQSPRVGASYPAPQPYPPAQQGYPGPQPYPAAQPNYPGPQPYPATQPSYPVASASDPYTDSPAIVSADTQDIPSQKRSSSRKIKTSSRSALPSPRRSGGKIKTDAGSAQDLPQVGAPGENDGWQTHSTGQRVPANSYPSVPYPGDPAAQYPHQAYPQQSYPQQSYPQQSYPQQSYPPVPYPEPVTARPAPIKRPAPAVVRKPAPVVARPAPVSRPAPAVARPAVARPAPVASSGRYRIQLGAFSNQGGADSLWKSLRGRIAGLSSKQPYLVKVGSITRLQAGNYASRGDAERACSAVRGAGASCLVVG